MSFLTYVKKTLEVVLPVAFAGGLILGGANIYFHNNVRNYDPLSGIRKASKIDGLWSFTSLTENNKREREMTRLSPSTYRWYQDNNHDNIVDVMMIADNPFLVRDPKIDVLVREGDDSNPLFSEADEDFKRRIARIVFE